MGRARKMRLNRGKTHRGRRNPSREEELVSVEPPSSGRPTGPPSGPLSGPSQPPSGPPSQPPDSSGGASAPEPRRPWWRSAPRVAMIAAAVVAAVVLAVVFTRSDGGSTSAAWRRRGLPPGRRQDGPRPLHRVDRDRQLRPARLRLPDGHLRARQRRTRRRRRRPGSLRRYPQRLQLRRREAGQGPSGGSLEEQGVRLGRRLSSRPGSRPICARSHPSSCAWTPASPTTATATAPPPVTRPSSRL